MAGGGWSPSWRSTSPTGGAGNPRDRQPGQAAPRRPGRRRVGAAPGPRALVEPSIRAAPPSAGPARAREHGPASGSGSPRTPSRGRAVLAADDLGRQRERQRVARPRANVELALVVVGRAEPSPPPGWSISRASTSTPWSAVSRQRTQGPSRSASKRSPERVPAHGVRDVEPRVHRAALQLVALPAELERIDRHLEVEAPPLTGREPELPTSKMSVRCAMPSRLARAGSGTSGRARSARSGSRPGRARTRSSGPRCGRPRR